MYNPAMFVYLYKSAGVFYFRGKFYQAVGMDHDDTQCVYTWGGLIRNTVPTWERDAADA